MASVISLIGIVLAYGAAYMFFRPVGRLFSSMFSLPPLLALPAAGLAIVSGVMILVSFGSYFLRRRLRASRRHSSGLARWDAVGGALLGGAKGAALVIVFVWLLALLQNFSPESVPNVRESFAAKLVMPTIRAAAVRVGKATGISEASSKVVGELLTDPTDIAGTLNDIFEDQRMQTLFSTPRWVEALSGSLSSTAMDHPAFQSLTSDDRFLRMAEKAGLLTGDSKEKSRHQIGLELTEKLAPLARVIVHVSRDEKTRELLEDDQFLGKLRSNDLPSLVHDERFNRLAGGVMQALRSEGTDSDIARSPSRPGAGSDKPTAWRNVYRWKTKDGVTKFSDHPPSDGSPYEIVNR